MEKAKRQKRSRDEVLEIITAIALGIVALLTAWATWIGSLHGGNQATNYAKSNNLSADANSRWNEASQNYLADLQIWNRISDLQIEIQFAKDNDDAVSAEKYEWQLNQIITDSVSEEFADAINWALDQEEYASPFDKEGYLDSYYADAQSVLQESEDVLAQGQLDNANDDRLGLVTVLYSVVLFLLGIMGTFKSFSNKMVVFAVSGICFVLATLLMCTVPLPTGFSLASFFHPAA